MILLLEKILPLLGVVVVIVLIAIVQKIAHPSKLVWGRILSISGLYGRISFWTTTSKLMTSNRCEGG